MKLYLTEREMKELCPILKPGYKLIATSQGTYEKDGDRYRLLDPPADVEENLFDA